MFSPARWLGILVALIIFFNLSSLVFASSVVINEFLPDPSGDNPEWVELYHTGGEPVNLSGWYLEDAADHKKPLDSLGQINPGEIKVFNGEKDGWLLNNGTETIYLRDGSNSVVDSYSYAADPGEDKSIGRESDGNSHWVIFDTPSKGTSNGSNTSPSPVPSSSPSPSPTPEINNIFINEVMACPNTGESEWVELFNANNQEVNLVGWQLRDSDDNHRQDVNLILKQNSLTKIQIENFALNNDGDSLRLFAQDNLKDSMSYSDCEKGYSWSKVNNSWCQTSPTPESGNSSCLSFQGDTGSEGSTFSSPSPSSITSNLLPSPAPKLKINLSSGKEIFQEATFTGEVFGASASASPSATPEPSKQPQNYDFLLPAGLVGGGLLLLLGATFPWYKPKIIKFFKREKL